MRQDFANLSPEEKKKLAQQLMQDAQAAEDDFPSWYDGKRVDEVAYCESLLARQEMRSINGRIYSMDGLIEDEKMKRKIAEDLKPYVRTSLHKKTDSVLQTLKVLCVSDPIRPTFDRIHFQNGTYHLEKGFSPDREWTMNRLPQEYDAEAPKPERWEKFLSELLQPDDILTLQEFMGYCMIATNRGQSMLLIIGSGGEGKSRISAVMQTIFGSNMNMGSIGKLESDKFCPADQECKLLFIDDDMKMEALGSTNTIKTIVTCEEHMDLERKNKQSFQGLMYVRLLCLGNGTLKALHDKSIGFYRRQIIIQTKTKPANRRDDPYLKDKLEAEIPGIILWAIQGLERLLQNDFKFTISEQSARLKAELMEEDNNIQAFLRSDGYIEFAPNIKSTTKQLYDAYQRWCNDNADKPMAASTFSKYLATNAEELKISPNKNVRNSSGKKVRGYEGIRTLSAGLPDNGSDFRELPPGTWTPFD